MEFDAEILGEYYHFTSINSSSVLVSGRNGGVHVSTHTLDEMGEIIDEHIHVRPK